jgi:hypothetical protein
MTQLHVQELIADSFVFARENIQTALRLGWPVVVLSVIGACINQETYMVPALLVMALTTVAGVMMQTGLYRQALYQQSARLQLGVVEGRVLAAMLLVMLFIVLSLAVVMGATVFTSVVGAIGAGVGKGGGGALAGLIALAMVAFGLGITMWLSVRLIAAIPATIDQGRVMVLQSLPITRGHFWPIFAAVLVIGLTVILAALVAAATVLLVMLVSGLSVDAFASKDPQKALEALGATPMTAVLYGALNGLLDVVIVTPLTVGLASSVYRRCAVAADPVAEPDVA